jgi:copper chaperone CopZ
MTAKLIKAINAVEANNAVKIKFELETSKQNIKEKIIYHEATLDKLKKRMESLERE